MYNLDELFSIVGSGARHEMWNGRISCLYSDTSRTMLTNQMADSFNGYTFTLVLAGRLTLVGGHGELQLVPGEMYTYYPGSRVFVQDISDDYRSICLMLDASLAHNTQAFRNLVRASVIPIPHYGIPKLTFTGEEVARLIKILELIHEYIVKPAALKNEILEMLTTVFIDDLISIRAFDKARMDISLRTENVFVAFYQLLQEQFIEQHGIAYYADRLHVSTNYLSRIVKRITGKTVVGCIDEMLAIEATWLLRSTNLTVAQIADRLNFASPPSFCKFYRRMRRCTPLSQRQQWPRS